MSALFQNYARRPFAIVEGKGTEVFDTTGKRYLDFTSGIAVCSLGHAHPSIVEAIQKQSEKLWHISNLFESPGQEQLAASLVRDLPLSYAFFCNSGAEANEAAIKLARKHTGKHKIIVFEQSFHGRTFGAMSATGQDKVRKGFGPLVSEFVTLPFNDVEALKAAVDDKTAAIMLEMIQGEGGVNSVSEGFAKAIHEIQQATDVLIIVDEVQTGIGRTGTRFAFEQTAIQPNIVSMAKGLGGGFPIGGILGTEELFDTFNAGTHGTTFGGNPLAVAVAQTVIDQVFDESFLNNVKQKSTYFIGKLKEAFPDDIYTIQGKGLMLGLGLGGIDVAPYVTELDEAGLLTVAAGPKVIRLLPPLTVSEKEIDEAVAVLKSVILK
ncbi:acetylornithine transaminase [Lysinibacillus sp. 2017]|uniref:acetylornithine transaminase n=1 Tax=unclassified Lysinibacillus TaxID=2636778 RepID=UPI000D5271DB|nr:MULTISPECIES: acetylornithine transaminase [unclassified Lysinibacillus]AWE08351.1 acetylornithine transaminase [Lysinibacillus sp. 2017]TGN35800.1 acetylornithine transaminase [Lysinibacillus sp. S2017]